MKVILIASSDWSNMGYILSECLNSVGVTASMFKTTKHRFKYPKQGIKVYGMDRVRKHVKNADVVQFMHSGIPGWFDQNTLKNKKIVVFHGGSKYRLNHAKINKIFNPIVDLTVIQTPDLLNLGAKNEIWIGPAIDTASIKPEYEVNDRLIVGHYPSSPAAKCSSLITKVMKSMVNKHGVDYRYSYTQVSWTEQIKRVASCDIYIENLAMKQKHANVGVWGLTALETAACADIVITPFIYVDLYRKQYGEFGPCVANSQSELEETLERLFTTPKHKILKLKKRNRRWVETLHSYTAIGQKLKEAYETIL